MPQLVADLCRKSKSHHTHHTVHVCLGPDDVMVVVDDHWPTQDVQVLHYVFLHIGQGGNVSEVTCKVKVTDGQV